MAKRTDPFIDGFTGGKSRQAKGSGKKAEPKAHDLLDNTYSRNLSDKMESAPDQEGRSKAYREYVRRNLVSNPGVAKKGGSNAARYRQDKANANYTRETVGQKRLTDVAGNEEGNNELSFYMSPDKQNSKMPTKKELDSRKKK